VGRAAIRVWEAAECERVHEATLRVLAECGVEVMWQPALNRFAEAGATVEGTRVRLGRELVEQALATAPKSWTVTSRGRAETLELADGPSYFGSGSDCLYVVDPDTHQRRRAVVDDIETLAVVCEQLDNVDFVMSMAFPENVPPEVEVLYQQVALLKGTRKPLLIVPRDGHTLAIMKQMAEACGGGDSLIVYGMPSPPLMHDEFALSKIIACAELLIPLVYAPAPTAGTTAPASITGVVVTGNAEVLSGLVLHQLVNPGAPFVYGAGCDTLDMRTMINPYVSPEWSMGCQAGRDLAHFYGLPSFSYGAYSDSKILDEQWAAETALTAMLGALSRGTLLHDLGYLEMGMQTSCEALVLGDELAGFAKACLRDIDVDDESLAVDEIIAVGPGGNHLARPYTRRHYREFWVPSLLDKAPHDRWQSNGATSLKERVVARVAELRARPRLFTLDAPAQAALQGLLDDACRELQVTPS
jgi:trimethylamine---corrinoid protein Co-methyltransferase